MTPQWLTGNKPERSGGRDGVDVILADVSSSMDRNTLTAALRGVVRAVPDTRVFVFADTVAEVPRLRNGGRLPDVGRTTDIRAGFEAVTLLRPQHTVVLSDGYETGGNCFPVADSMTGAISRLWFGTAGADHSLNFGGEFMQELARRGGGQFLPYDIARGASGLAQEILDILRIERIHHHHLPPVHIHRGDRPQHGVGFSPATVRVRHR